jgi:acetyl esterase/lipase
MRNLSKTISLLVLAMSGMFFFRVKSPRSGPLALPKMVAASLASYLSALGFLNAGLGLLVRSPIALLAGGLGGLLSLRYIRRATAQHDGFERAFGEGWQEKLSPERSAAMLPNRWTWQLPDAPAGRVEQDIAFWTLPDGSKLLADVWQPPAGVQPSGLAVIYFHGSGWHLLDKDFGTRFFFRHLAAQGHVVMDVAYRLCPEAEVVGMVGDAKAPSPG